MEDKTISIVIVGYNGRRWIKKCLDSLLAQSRKNFEIIWVDNASRDGSADHIKEHYPSVRLVGSKTNRGFAGGNDLGIEAAKGEYVLLLNQDTWVETDFLEKLERFYLENDFDIVSVLEGDYHSKKIKNRDFFTRIDPFGQTISLKKNGREEQFNLCGFCLFFPKKLYHETGGMDAEFFMYLEDIDWFWRLKLFRKNAGLAEGIVAYHAGTADGRELRYDIFFWRNRNIPRMMLKNYRLANLLWAMPLYLLQNIFEAVFFLAIGKPELSLSYVQSWFLTAKDLGLIMKKRRWVQKRRMAGDWEIMRKYFYFGSAKFVQLMEFYAKR